MKAFYGGKKRGNVVTFYCEKQIHIYGYLRRASLDHHSPECFLAAL